MKEYIYTTWTRSDNEWVRDMLNNWRRSKKPYLCFPWIRFRVRTLPDTSFWMYMYYGVNLTDIPYLKGRVEFRIHVNDWAETRFSGDDIYLSRGDEEGKIWFNCDQFQEIRNINNELITLDDFRHLHNKNLISTMRNSIPPVICDANIKVIEQHSYRS